MKSPVIVQQSFLASASSRVGRLEVVLEKRVRLILLEELLVLLLVPELPGVKVDGYLVRLLSRTDVVATVLSQK